MFKLWLVIPCYNEEEVLPETSRRLEAIISALVNNGKIAPESRICFVNDGSKDKTWDIISRLYNENPLFAGLNLARNRGHQNALLAGLMFARKHADAVISLDADLQDDVAAIEKFVDEYLSGSDIVYGVRCSRSSDSFFKRSTAQNFYKLMKFMGVDIVYNHADYRLMSRRALDALSQFEEVNLFLRGIAPQIGFKTSTVEYVRAERFAGESKYPLKKMLAFAFEGITSFSVKPLRIATILGCGAFFISLIMLLYVLVQFFSGNTVSGWASLGVSIWALGGLQLLMTGIVGEYIGKVYLESKHRPRYIIESELLR
jgi:glycosyltransferase involved in cell wall biosynthesis